MSSNVYTNPLHPGPLEVDVFATHHTATRLRTKHRDAVHIFQRNDRCPEGVDKKIVQAIETEYINTLRNRTINTITANIQTILAHLIRRYGIVGTYTLS